MTNPRNTRKAFIAVACLTGTLITIAAEANFGPPAFIFDFVAEQQGQNVLISAGFAGDWSGDTGDVHRIDLSTETEVLVDNLVNDGQFVEWLPTPICNDTYDPPNPVEVETICLEHPEVCVDCDDDGQNECYPDCESCADYDWGGIYPDCDKLPFYCDDCNGDEVPECFGGCMLASHYLLVEPCVPPGRYNYHTEAQGLMGNTDETFLLEVQDIEFDKCEEEPGDDSNADSGTDTDTDSDLPSDGSVDQDLELSEGDGGCSLTGGPGVGKIGGIIALLSVI